MSTVVKTDKAKKTAKRVKDSVQSGQNVGFGDIDQAPAVANNQAKSAFDAAPVKWFSADQRDQKMADLIKLQKADLLGQDKVLGARGTLVYFY